MGKRTDKNIERAQTALLLRLRGLTYVEIGTQLGVSRQRAQQLVRPPHEIYEIIKKRGDGRCEECGVKIASGQVHHRQADRELSAFNEIENLQYLCRGCHTKKHDLGSLAFGIKRGPQQTCLKCGKIYYKNHLCGTKKKS